MKNAMCLLVCLLMCLPLANPAFAAADDVVLVIGYKDAPYVVNAQQQDDEDVKDCLVVTSIRAAREMTTDITQDERDELLEIYDKLLDGSLKFPLEEDYMIWELMDVSYQKTGCRDNEHDHEEWLEQENTTVTITFDSGVAKAAEVEVLAYRNEKWAPVKEVINNGDGTLSCIFDEICPVVFCLKAEKQDADAVQIVPLDGFVPSVGPMDGPEIVGGEIDGGGMRDCLVVTSITAAKEKSTDITQDERDELLEIYDKLLDGSMEIPLEEGYVIRELVDISYKTSDCRNEDHGHQEWLKRENTTVTVIFDLGVAEDAKMQVLAYVNEEWMPAKDVINIGDGTVVCIFNDICPVAFCLSPEQ